MDVVTPRDERRSSHAAKACGPDAPGLALSLRVGDVGPSARRAESPQATVTKKSRTPGRVRNKPPNHCAGNADALADL